MSYPDRQPAWRRYLRLVRRDVPADVDAELRFHLESRIEELIAEGHAPHEARARAVREFGDVDSVRRDLVSIDDRLARRRGRAEWLADLLGDAGYAVRSLSRTPGAALAILATLALGIGANASMFTFLDAVFLRAPAGVVRPAGIRRLWVQRHFSSGTEFWPGYSYAQFDAVRQASDRLADAALYTAPQKAKIGLGETDAQAQVSHAGTAFFAITGARASLGRLYLPDEDRLDDPVPVAVVSRRYWERTLASDPRAVGTRIIIGGAPYTIVGVAQESFTGVDLDATDVWLPLAFEASGRGGKTAWWKNPNVNGFQILLRPRAGVSDAQLEQRITTVLRRPDYGYISDSLTVARFGSIVAANGPGTRAREVQIAVRLAGVAAAVLLIACANVVNLLLARAMRRRREIAVRIALGISRARLVRLLLVESGVLAVAAACVAIVVAYVGGTLLRKLLLPEIHWASSPVDWRLVAFAIAAALVTGALAGLVPAFHAADTDVTNGLKAGGALGAPHRSRLRAALVVAQAALSVMLLAGAGLFVRSLDRVRGVDIGFDSDRVISATVKYDSAARAADPTFAPRLAQLRERIAALPGVARVAIAGDRPLNSISWLTFFTDTDSLRRGFTPTFAPVSRGYFAASGTRLLRGEDFAEPSVAPTVIVNEEMARLAWPNASPIGKCLYFGARGTACYRVIGVAENSREHELFEEPRPRYYLALDALPKEANGWRGTSLIANVDPARATLVIPSIRSLLRQQFPDGIPTVVRMTDDLEPQYRPWKLGALLFTAFGGLAFLVAAIGIYSSVAYGVNQRLHEFGVRVALGATLTDIVRYVVAGGLRVVAAGVALGIALALAAGKLVASLLYGVAPNDPLVLTAVAAVLLSAGVIAALVPAWRAGRVDPLVALRSD